MEHFELMDHQKETVDLLGNGKILYGPVGAGKSVTAFAYYMKAEKGKDVYVITTAKKRDSLDWERDGSRFGLGTTRDATLGGVLRVDSWNNISKYLEVEDAFFIFDEQRVVGSGTWVKSFIKLAKKNNWILLSATPGDTWMDYAPVFIANGWYKNLTEFKREHVVYAPFVKFPKIVRYLGQERLEKLRNEILVEMPYKSKANRISNWLQCGYDLELWKTAVRKRWNPYEDAPIKDVGELFRVMRRIVNSDPSRLEMVLHLMDVHPRLIVFYNFNYELEILRTLADEVPLAEYNGHKKEPIPDTERWVYLVQIQAGAEGWNCTSTDAMVLYSLTYSYKNFIQLQGRIDRVDSPFTDLYYYFLASAAPIDSAIRRAVSMKKDFNERSELAKTKNW